MKLPYRNILSVVLCVLLICMPFTSPRIASATTWNAVVDDSFSRGDTSTGIAGSVTGVGNDWIDVAGGVWNIGSNKLQGISSSSSDYLTSFLVRPSNENTQDAREIVTIPAGENFGQYLGAVLRYQSSTKNHYLAHISASGIYLYKIVGGATTLISSNLMSISNADSYSVDFSALGVNSTALSVVVTDVTTSTQVGTISATDSESSLQTLGSIGLSTWYNTGTHTIHASRVQTFTTGLAIRGNSSFVGTSNVAIPITDLQISGNASTTTPVKLLVTSGTLAMSTVTGLTFTGGQTGSTLYFTGTVSDINAALSTLTYTRNGTGSDTLEVSLVNSGEVFFPNNGHLYKFISSTGTWNNANTAAASQTAYGANGYLATITSSAENIFISSRLSADGWIGASDSVVEGDWKWVTGPETGTSFWSGLGSNLGGHTVGGNYANWNTNEPNDSGGNEDCAEYYSGSSKWNDLPCSGTTLSGYVVEFGATGNMPVVVAKNISITTSNNPTVSTVTPADNATNINPATNLTLNFSTAITIGSGNILIKRTSDDSTVESIDVTGAQVTGGGTSAIVVDPSALADSTGYYIIIPGTAFKDGSNNFYAGISDSTTWNFTTGDFTPPTIISVSSNHANGSFTVGEVIGATVTFSEPVTTTGLVTLTFETGAVDRTCTFSIVSSTTGNCNYTVQSGDTTSDLTVSTIAGTIKDAALNVLTNFTPASNLADSKNIVIDTTAPVLTTVAAIAASFLPTNATMYRFTSSEVCTYAATQPSSSLGPVAVHIDPIVTPNTDLSAYLFGIQPGGTYSFAFNCTDAAGNVSNSLAVGPFTEIGVGSSGGGALPVVPISVATIPDSSDRAPLDFTINNNAPTTTSPTLSIVLNADQKKVNGYAISLDPLFKNEGIHPYADSVSYTLPNAAGSYLIYLKYYSITGDTSDVIKHAIAYAPSVHNNISVAAPLYFKTILKYGDKNSDVILLQKFLNTHNSPVSISGPGSAGNETNLFSAKTRKAVTLYQKAKNIIPANGVVGTKTQSAIMTDMSGNN